MRWRVRVRTHRIGGCGRVGLAKGFKDVSQVFFGDADALVINRHRQGDATLCGGLVGRRDVSQHLATLSELDGIADEIREYPPDPAGIAKQ